MGLTHVEMEIANPNEPERSVWRKLLVDSGALFTVLPAAVLQELGINPVGKQEFRLANGETISRQTGVALFKYDGRAGGGTVVFGEAGDADLCGVLTLEGLGLGLDPIKHELIDVPMLLVGMLPNFPAKATPSS